MVGALHIALAAINFFQTDYRQPPFLFTSLQNKNRRETVFRSLRFLIKLSALSSLRSEIAYFAFYYGFAAYLLTLRFYPFFNLSARRGAFFLERKNQRTFEILSYSSLCLATSIQPIKPEYFSISGIVSSIALLLLPQAGNTVSKRLRLSSR